MAWSIRWRDGSGHHGRVITMDPPVTVMIPSSADAVWIGPDPEPLSRHDLASMPTFLGALDVVHAYDAWSITWPSAFDEHVAWMWWSSDGSGASGHQYASARSGIRLSGLPHGSYEVVAISSHGSARASFVVDPDQTSWSWREYWWPCTEGAGEIIHERMVGDDARAHAPSWHQDSLFFNGITDAIDMPVAPFLLRQESGSLSWWVCLADPYDDGDQVMWSTKTIWNDPWGWEILYRYDPLDGMGRLVFLGSDYGPFVDVPVDPRDMTGWVRVTSAWRADPDTAFGIASLAINDRVLARDMRIRGPWAFPWSIPPRIGGPAGGSDERRRLTGYMADVELGPRERFDVVRLRGDEKPDPVPVFPHVPNRWTAGALIITVQAPGMRVTDHVGRSGTRFSVDPGLPWSLTLHPMMSQ
jgi:hypothetical protein